MTAGLEPGPAYPEPFAVPMSLVPSFDVIEVLPVGAAERLRKRRDHVHDLHALTTPFEDIREASDAKVQAEQRLKRLTDHQHNGGFNLCDDDPRVLEQRRLLDKLNDNFTRLNERNETRSQAWREAGYTLQAVEGWLRNGVPTGVVLEDIDGKPQQLLKNESLLDGILRLQRRGRELKADLARISAAPYPSAHVRAKIKLEVEALAQAGAPVVADAVEHDRGLVWPMQRLTAGVVNSQVPSFAATEVVDVLALTCWLHKDTVLAALDREITSESDDAAALSAAERETRAAVVMGDLLAVEHDEARLVWQAQADKLPVEHRRDCAPAAILQVRLVTAPAVNRRGTSPEHAFNIIGGR